MKLFLIKIIVRIIFLKNLSNLIKKCFRNNNNPQKILKILKILFILINSINLTSLYMKTLMQTLKFKQTVNILVLLSIIERRII